MWSKSHPLVQTFFGTWWIYITTWTIPAPTTEVLHLLHCIRYNTAKRKIIKWICEKNKVIYSYPYALGWPLFKLLKICRKRNQDSRSHLNENNLENVENYIFRLINIQIPKSLRSRTKWKNDLNIREGDEVSSPPPVVLIEKA